jgi:hypothetical protein
VVGDGLGVLERAPIIQICGDARRTESVTTRGVGQAGGLGATLDHVQHVESGHRLLAEPVALAHAGKQRPFLVAPNSGRGDPDVQELIETPMAGYLVALAAFLVT